MKCTTIIALLAAATTVGAVELDIQSQSYHIYPERFDNTWFEDQLA